MEGWGLTVGYYSRKAQAAALISTLAAMAAVLVACDNSSTVATPLPDPSLRYLGYVVRARKTWSPRLLHTPSWIDRLVARLQHGP